MTATLRLEEPRGPDASPAGGPQYAAHASRFAAPPGRRPTPVPPDPQSIAPPDSQPNPPPHSACRPPPEALCAWATRPATKGRKSTAHPPPHFRKFVLGAPQFDANGGATSSVELQSSACQGVGLRDSSSRKSSAQSTPQFSAPCPPHCGSAFAPPPSGTPK